MRKLFTKNITFLSITISILSVYLVFSPNALFAKNNPETVVGSNIFVDVAEKENPAVVHISAKSKVEPVAHGQFRERPFRGDKQFKDFFGPPRGPQRNVPRRSSGTGFIIDKEGYVFTNNHVVSGAEEIKVSLENGEEYIAKVIGADPKTDIALIKIDTDKELPFVIFGNSDELRVGEWVMAIGNPFGLSHTVTVGVVSAKGRVIGSGPYDDYIQTDASINPGNSGGPLINTKGEVIGINSAIYSGSTGGNIGIGFAIPINLAKGILDDLKLKGTVTRGRLGVTIQKLTPELAKSFDLSVNEGALVGDVLADSPAEKGGIKRGDVIIEFDGKPIKSMEQLPQIVAQTRPGEEVEVIVIRNGKRMSVKTVIDKLEDKETLASANIGKFGLQAQDITPELMKSLELESTDGVLVADVKFESPAGDAGIRRGDIITEVNREKVIAMKDFREKMGHISKENTVLFLIKRGGSTVYIAMKTKP
jgi:serine protease Do